MRFLMTQADCRTEVWKAGARNVPGSGQRKTANMGGFIGGYYYKVIRWSKGYCVLRYQIMSQYRSAFLRKYFPPPEVLILGLMLLAVLTVVLLTAVRFSG